MNVVQGSLISRSGWPEAVAFNAEWRAQSIVRHADRSTVKAMVETQHYLRCFPAVTPCILAMYVGLEPVGCVVFAFPPRETMQRYGGMTWELARLWIDDRIPRNAETWLIGKAMRHVRTQHREVKCVVSYADPSQGHSGTIYRAANFTDDGRTDEGRMTPRADYLAAGKRYQRRAHVPEGALVERVPRISKHRFVYHLGQVPS